MPGLMFQPVKRLIAHGAFIRPIFLRFVRQHGGVGSGAHAEKFGYIIKSG